MNGKTILQTMKPYKPGKQIEDVKKEYGLNKIVKLASNENPFGYSPQVKEAITDISTHLELYPDGYATELREALVNQLNVKPDQLVFGSGSDEVIAILCQAFLESGTNTITATPTFPQYKHNALIQGADVKEVPVVNGYHDLDAMLNEIDENTKIVWLCTPNNPTGTLIEEASLIDFMERCPSDVLVVVDEAYYEYVRPEDAPDSIKAIETYPNLVVLRTFSKAYGLAALRVGYGVATETIANLLNIVRGPFNTTSIAQKAALIALEDQQFLQDTVKQTLANKKKFMEFLDRMGLTYYDSATNFVFVNLPVTGDELFEHLLTKGFIVRSGEALGHPKGARITIGHEEDMKLLQDLIEAYLTPAVKENQS
ncbi:histidinol-phosphate aminotransferase [Paraliobacillus ryukyuensis]|uniref:Histidinol-phosphate aminotransferase n=1 Tax=Paraliobacillus ryukyuensis TaxID=200904 RepID=A0A366EGS9_9BACI|nr:histidinol-phosphate transaminase [Paraliobacillus ryukyuensis]RBP01538.1 histidinol-phosphate aminotransferase [Paraliobacillus ryukyuensis]